MDTIREQILQALATRTGATRMLQQYDPRDLPITVLAEGDDAATEKPYGMTAVTMPVTIARAIPLTGTKDDTWYAAANEALGNLIVEIYTGGDTLGGLCQGLDYAGGSVELLSDGADGAAVQASVTVRFQFRHGNPFYSTEG